MATQAQINALTGLYVGYFKRSPDPAGLQFWIDQIDGGRDFNTIAQDFASSQEARDLYPYLSNPDSSSPLDFIATIYQNLFNRTPDAAGLTFWYEVLTEGKVSVGDMIEAVLNGARDSDARIVENKIEVAHDWTLSVSAKPGFTYDADAAVAAKAAIANVDMWQASVDRAKAQTDDYVAGKTGDESPVNPENEIASVTGTVLSYAQVIVTDNHGDGKDDQLTLNDGADISGLSLTGWENVTLASGATVTMAVAQHETTVLGNGIVSAAGSETINLTDGGTLTGLAQIETYTLGGASSFTLGAAGQNVTGSSAADTISSTIANLAGATINGAGDADTLVLLDAGAVGGISASVTNVETLTLANGTNTGVAFNAAGVITNVNGGTGSDTIASTANLLAGGNVLLGDGADTVTMTADLAGSTINMGADNDTLTSTVNGVITTTMTGGDGVDTLSLAGSDNISAASVTGFENLTLASDASVTMTAAQHNQFTGTVTGTGSETIRLADGDTLTGHAQIETYTLGGASTFTLGAVGQDVTGSGLGDTFNATADQLDNAHIDGLQGDDTLNITGGTTAVDLSGAQALTNVETLVDTGGVTMLTLAADDIGTGQLTTISGKSGVSQTLAVNDFFADLTDAEIRNFETVSFGSSGDLTIDEDNLTDVTSINLTAADADLHLEANGTGVFDLSDIAVTFSGGSTTERLNLNNGSNSKTVTVDAADLHHVDFITGEATSDIVTSLIINDTVDLTFVTIADIDTIRIKGSDQTLTLADSGFGTATLFTTVSGSGNSNLVLKDQIGVDNAVNLTATTISGFDAITTDQGNSALSLDAGSIAGNVTLVGDAATDILITEAGDYSNLTLTAGDYDDLTVNAGSAVTVDQGMFAGGIDLVDGATGAAPTLTIALSGAGATLDLRAVAFGSTNQINTTVVGTAGNDSITGPESTANGSTMRIDLSSGGDDTVNLATLTKVTVEHLGSGDEINIEIDLGDKGENEITSQQNAAVSATAGNTQIVSLNASTTSLIATTGAETIADFTSMADVAGYLEEGFDEAGAAATDDAVFILNDGTNSYIYAFDQVATSTDGIDDSELSLVGVVNGHVLTGADVFQS